MTREVTEEEAKQIVKRWASDNFKSSKHLAQHMGVKESDVSRALGRAGKLTKRYIELIDGNMEKEVQVIRRFYVPDSMWKLWKNQKK